MPDLEPTIDLPSRKATGNAPRDDSFSILELQHPGTAENITQQFNESTRQLLHQRLLIAGVSTLGFLVVLKVVSLLFGNASLYQFLTRIFGFVVIVGVVAFLYRNPMASMRKLRIAEFLSGMALAVDCVWVLVAETQDRIAVGNTADLPTLFVTVSFAFAIFIAIYGMFIPGNWRRTAAVTCMSALVPSVAAIALRQFYPALQLLEGFPGFIAPVLTMVMAIVATLAAHVVHQIRREAEAAKQYGQYQLLEEIGQGGMGVVHKAKHQMLKRPAAIKLIRNEIANDPKTVEAFEHEVQLSAELTHWNSIQIYDYGRTDEGDFYYVMEYLEGESLLDRIRRAGKLTNQETVNFIGQACDGLQEAHLKGMVHRDIKPANVFLANNAGQPDVVKILDFGLAAMKSETDRLKKVSGSPSYMSPEQINGQEIDERCDIYALGCVIFECLSGQRLVLGDSIGEVLDQQLHQKPSLDVLPESSQRFRDVIAQCLEKDARNRFPNVAALKQALGRCV